MEWKGAFFDARVEGVTYAPAEVGAEGAGQSEGSNSPRSRRRRLKSPERARAAVSAGDEGKDAGGTNTRPSLRVTWLRDGSMSTRVPLSKVRRADIKVLMPDLLPPDDKLGSGSGSGGSSSSGAQAMQMTFGKGFKNKRKDDKQLRSEGVPAYEGGAEPSSSADVIRRVRERLGRRLDKLMMAQLLPGAKAQVWETIQKDEYRKHRLYRKSVDQYLDPHVPMLRVIFERFTLTGDGIFEKEQKRQSGDEEEEGGG